MLHTYLTTSWHLRYPIIGAPIAYVGRGRLARAVSQAGGLGMIGIGSTESVEFLAQGVAAALAAGAEGVWIGTALLASPECENTEQARTRIVQAQETDTVLTRAFDIAQGLAWPPQYPDCAGRDRFTDEWHAHVDALPQASEARQQLAEAIASKNYDLAYIYAGQAVGLITRQQPAGDVIQYLGDGAEHLLRGRSALLLEGHKD